MSFKLTILTFHRIIKRHQSYFIDPMAICEETFSRLIKKLFWLGSIVSLPEAIESLKIGSLKGNNFAITFDDGYVDNYTVACDILSGNGIPATFFIPFRQIDESSVFWWDYIFSVVKKNKPRFVDWIIEEKIEKYISKKNIDFEEMDNISSFSRIIVQFFNSLDNNTRIQLLDKIKKEFGQYNGPRLLMNWHEIRILKHKGFEIGSHTVSHIPLTDLSDSQAYFEIKQSKKLLSEKIDSDVMGFCYPRGSFSDKHVEMVKDSNYLYAVSTQFGRNVSDLNPYKLHRWNMSDYPDIRNCFATFFYLIEMSGISDHLLLKRRIL